MPDEHDVIVPFSGPGAVHVGEGGEVSLLNKEDVVRAFHASSKRVLFFDYGGTLVDLEGEGCDHVAQVDAGRVVGEVIVMGDPCELGAPCLRACGCG